MAIVRSTILRGPGIIGFKDVFIYTEGDITINFVLDTFEINTSIFGKVDERAKDVKIEIGFKPDGYWGNFAVLFPYANAIVGASVFGDDDVPLNIWMLSGKAYTFPAAAVTKMPSISASATKTLLGDMQISCLRTDNTDWSSVDSLVAFETGEDGTYPGDADFSSAGILTQSPSIAWGSSPWNALQTKDGVMIDFDLSLTPIETDANGVVDMMFSKLAVNVKATPIGLTEEQVIAALKVQGTGAVRGRSLSAGGTDMVVTATGFCVKIYKAALKSAPLMGSQTNLRIGELNWIATRSFNAGVANPLFYVGTSAPA